MKKVFSYLPVAEFMRAGLIAFSQSFTAALETRGPSLASIGGGRKKMLLITQLYRQRACIAVAPKTHIYTHTHHNYYSRTVEDGRFSYGRDDDAFVKKMAERVRPFFSSFSAFLLLVFPENVSCLIS